ncbi:Cof-type HAD-IIB family hydrolase [Actinokineospora sp. NBRC 105648]|uniref:Cof-type HAD-IIB family hydrolase n=1 Tax=Actinokineospora sp. NBRC 105648 TaxID=3032206 RepID=UPI0024A22F85|nr:Cof-type HAD-IIB family hydrolase [Actinokineospora sp. NBRC 105648]GLZ40644.1 haloacid dehalogenase [Actinokineospora sp. NBRC 105648]
MDKPALVASDVDGTLLAPQEELTPRTLAAISRILADGTPFVLVSGRPPRWIPPVADQAGLHGYAVCANGAIIYDISTRHVLSAHTLDPIVLHDVARVLDKALPGMFLATERAFTGPALGLEAYRMEPGFSNPWGDQENNFHPRAEVLGHPATKLLVRHQGMTSAEMASAAGELLGDAVDITYSTNRGLIEISARGVTKATGLAEVALAVGATQESTIAFGDMPNDIEMLRWAGHGVAMANANDEVKAAADEITAPNSEDGVALVLERWF